MVESDAVLSRRERQIMDVIYRLGDASVGDVQAEMTDPPSYSTVRTLMGVLAEKGHLAVEREGPRYRYRPTTSREDARATALHRLLSIFFDDSPTQAMSALMDLSASELTEEELDRLETMIREARKEGR